MTCCVQECPRPVEKRGMCGGHYRRWQRNGDVQAEVPLRAISARGEPYRWLLDHAAYDGVVCLRWPFYSKPDGYGALSWKGRTRNASALMCEIAHGERPNDSYEAAHSCGKGHLGCVNPRHLRWATHQENGREAVQHGSFPRGETHWGSKLTDDEVDQLRAAVASGTTHTVAAHRFGISRGHVSAIRTGRRRQKDPRFA